MKLSDIIMIIAVLFAPVIAVQVSQYLERQRSKKEGKLKVFKTLMATRAAQMAPAHIEALNMIDVEFYGTDKKNQNVTNALKAYFDHLADRSYPDDAWGIKRQDLLIELLYTMAKNLDYDFDKTHIKNSSYSPVGYSEVEDDWTTIRKGFIELLNGNISLPMNITIQEEQTKPQQKHVTTGGSI